MLRSFALGAVFPAALVGAAALAGPPPPPPTNPFAPPPCRDQDAVCIVGAAPGASWHELSDTTAADRKQRGKAAPGTIKIKLEVERASLFVNGRFVGSSPFQDAIFQLPSGKNDLQFRNGRERIAKGVLVMPSGGSLELQVRSR